MMRRRRNDDDDGHLHCFFNNYRSTTRGMMFRIFSQKNQTLCHFDDAGAGVGVVGGVGDDGGFWWVVFWFGFSERKSAS